MKALNRSELLLSALLAVSCTPPGGQDAGAASATVEFAPDMMSLVRNPMTGWALYDDANDYVADAAEYWDDSDRFSTGVPAGRNSNPKKESMRGTATRISRH